MQAKVSVIVPVYNAASYLSRCLDTLTHQSLKELELILVLDCPTDGSDKIAETYAKQYSNIKLIYNKTNLHVSESRNIGMAVATGEYIGFSDADDFQELRMYEDMYIVAKQRNADLLMIDRKTYNPCEKKVLQLSEIEQIKIEESEEFARRNLLMMIAGKFELYLSWVYTHLYRREFLQSNKIIFSDSRTMMAEDLLFNIQVYHRLLEIGGKSVYLPQAYYYYDVHEGSLCHSEQFYTFSMTIPLIENICKVIEYSRVYNLEEISEVLGRRIIGNVYSSWCKETLQSGWLHAMKELLKMRNSTILKRNLKRYKKISNPELPLKKNIFAFFLKVMMI